VVSFVGGEGGIWRVDRQQTVTGPPLPVAARLAVVDGEAVGDHAGVWVLRGTTSPAAAEEFEDLVGLLRETEEWSYVDREIDL